MPINNRLSFDTSSGIIISPSTGELRSKIDDDENEMKVISKIETASQSSAVCPSANALLNLVGNWLFDAALNEKKDFFQGRAEAISLLGKIFCRRSKYDDIDEKYICSYFLVISKALETE